MSTVAWALSGMVMMYGGIKWGAMLLYLYIVL